MDKNQDDVFYGYLQFSNHLQTHKRNIAEHTPIMYNGRVVGHTVGNNTIGYPVNCVLYSHCLNEVEMLDGDNAYAVASLELRGEER